VFDAGGTLVHPDWLRLGQLIAEETGQEFTPAQMYHAFYRVLRIVDAELLQGTESMQRRQPHWGFLDAFRNLGVDEAACNRLGQRLNGAHLSRHLWCEPDEEAPAVLHRLRSAGLRIAVISNTEDGRLEDSLTLAHLGSQFEFLIDSHIVGHRKPESKIFRLALDRFGLEPHVAVYVGDSYGYDVMGAQKAGLLPILLDRLGTYEDVECARIRKLSDLTGSSNLFR